MVELAALHAYCDRLLDIERFDDYCPNGLQVETTARVGRLVTGVTACQALIDAAVDWKADAILVHHGYFWRGEEPCLLGIKGRRIASLIRNDLSLLAYHLPLDAHRGLGNNAQLARVLDIAQAEPTDAGTGLVWRGRLETVLPASALAERIATALGRAPVHLPGGPRGIETLAWCSGAAQGFLEQAAALPVDAYISGEVSEQTTHQARELGVHYFAAGHHATERYGVSALGEHLAEQFTLEHRFIDIPNPI